VLLLHGLAGGAAAWDPFVERAAPQLELWDADLPWGGGGAPGWGRAGDLAGRVRESFDSVAAGTPNAGRVDLALAHSFGANLLLELLCAGGLRHPPGAAVLVSPFHRADPAEFDWPTISYFLNGFHLILEEGVRIRAAGRIGGRKLRAISVRLRDLHGPYGWIRFFDTYLRTPDLPLDCLRQPFLIVGGARDTASSARDCTSLADRLADSRAEVLADCGHFAMVERPDAFARLINGFADRLAAALGHTPSPTTREQTCHDPDLPRGRALRPRAGDHHVVAPSL
jgi:pimeloyl-ACP methyl ester carboxylesterase